MICWKVEPISSTCPGDSGKRQASNNEGVMSNVCQNGIHQRKHWHWWKWQLNDPCSMFWKTELCVGELGAAETVDNMFIVIVNGSSWLNYYWITCFKAIKSDNIVNLCGSTHINSRACYLLLLPLISPTVLCFDCKPKTFNLMYGLFIDLVWSFTKFHNSVRASLRFNLEITCYSVNVWGQNNALFRTWKFPRS